MNHDDCEPFPIHLVYNLKDILTAKALLLHPAETGAVGQVRLGHTTDRVSGTGAQVATVAPGSDDTVQSLGHRVCNQELLKLAKHHCLDG